MVHLITAVIKPHKLEDVKDALRGVGVLGMTITARPYPVATCGRPPPGGPHG